MTSLRAKFIRELTIRGRAERTIHSYVARVAALSKYYHRSPDQITDEEIRAWLAHLRAERKLSGSSLNVAVQAGARIPKVGLGRDRALLRSCTRADCGATKRRLPHSSLFTF